MTQPAIKTRHTPQVSSTNLRSWRSNLSENSKRGGRPIDIGGAFSDKFEFHETDRPDIGTPTGVTTSASLVVGEAIVTATSLVTTSVAGSTTAASEFSGTSSASPSMPCQVPPSTAGEVL
eukprot:scaffold69548_cov70-Phaeocystis_antarctica.AAC.2